MEKQTVFGFLAVLLLTVSGFSSAEEITAYFKVDGELTLSPTFNDRITNILWKLKGDLVAEWIEKTVPLDYYGRFKDRTTLDIQSGSLVMKNLRMADEGEFTVEINNKVHPQRFIGKAIKEVPKPIVWPSPLSCHADLDSCALSCDIEGDGDTKEAEPITYEWLEEGGTWLEKGKNITITKTGSTGVKTYTCKMKNPVSERKSEPKDNPFYIPITPPSIELIIGISIPVIIAVALGVLAWFKREKIMSFMSKTPDENVSKTDNGNKASPYDGGESSEHVALSYTTGE
ncbi:SLAM family member 5-like [Notolabrus celidotus]|uniref:SLAM family member 5-like n=1 Tax=Notolabrus celidotus TaxID=1203425 RepID=UPI0014901D3C|nr:SLAM family member 5-like [Notolabrus celidotus]